MLHLEQHAWSAEAAPLELSAQHAQHVSDAKQAYPAHATHIVVRYAYAAEPNPSHF